MGALDKLRSILGLEVRAALPAGTSLEGGVLVSAYGTTAPRRGTRELLQAYREQPWLRTVASRIARGVANAKWSVYVRAEAPARSSATYRSRIAATGRVRDVATAPAFDWRRDRSVRDWALISGDIEQRAAHRRELAAAGLLREVPDHPLLDVLNRPNSFLTGRASIQVTQNHLDIKGESFWLLQMEDGVPVGYMPIPPHWVTETPSSSSPTFRVSYGALQMNVPAEQMIWLRDPDPENPYSRGTGVGEALGDELETDEAAAKYVKNWFFNNGMPSAVVSFEGADATSLKQLREGWEREHRGLHNAHRVHFSAGKMNALRLDASFKDTQVNELRKMSRDTIAQVFAVPPEMIGIIENSNRATISAARYIYALGVEFPRVEFLRDELQAQLAPIFDEDIAIEAEVSVPDDDQRRLDVFRAMPGAFGLNEWRGEAGYEPRPEFEGLFPPLAMPGQQLEDPAPPEAKQPELEEPDDAAETELEPERPEKAAGEPPWVAELHRRR